MTDDGGLFSRELYRGRPNSAPAALCATQKVASATVAGLEVSPPPRSLLEVVASGNAIQRVTQMARQLIGNNGKGPVFNGAEITTRERDKSRGPALKSNVMYLLVLFVYKQALALFVQCVRQVQKKGASISLMN